MIGASFLRYGRPIVEALADVVEPSVAHLSRTARWVAVETSGNDLAFYRVRAGKTVFLGNGADLEKGMLQALRRAKRPLVELRLASGKVVSDRLKIPAEAGSFAARIVESRLDRLTPWHPEKLLYGFSGDTKPDVDGQIGIDFLATSRDISAAAIARLQTFGLVPSRIGSSSEPIETPLRIDLLQGESDEARKGRRRMIARAGCFILLLSSACLLASTYGVWLSGEQTVQAANGLTGARQQLMASTGGNGAREREAAILAEKTPEGARFAMIDKLAGVIPDDTYLDQLDIQPGSVRIAGLSSGASSLIAILESQPGFSDATFSAPVTRQDDGRDRFDITVVYSPANREPLP